MTFLSFGYGDTLFVILKPGWYEPQVQIIYVRTITGDKYKQEKIMNSDEQ